MDKENPGKHILVIEDNKTVADAMVVILGKEGYETKVAYDGQEGYEMIHSTHPDLVLLDIMLPKLDGRDLLKKVKEEDDIKDIPIIIISAKKEDWDKEIGFKLGAHEYITKPLEPIALISQVRRLFRKMK